jgi:DNA-binding transcriptional LysR family regulator
VKLLERTVQATLIERDPRPSRVTDAGRRLIATSETIIESLLTVLSDIREPDQDGIQRVTFGAQTHFCGQLLPTLYATFQQRFPGIDVDVEQGRPDALTESLLEGRRDLIVVLEPVPHPQLQSALLAELDVVLAGPPGHALSGAPPAQIAALESEKIVGSGPLPPTGTITPLHYDWVAGSVEAQINAVLNDMGIAPVPYSAVRSLARAGDLSILSVEGFPLRVAYHLVWRAQSLSAPTRAFRDYLFEQRQALEAVSQFRP